MKYSVEDLCKADIVIVPAGIIEEEKGKKRPYTENLSKKASAGTIPPAPTYYSQREAPTIEGTWVRNMVRFLFLLDQRDHSSRTHPNYVSAELWA